MATTPVKIPQHNRPDGTWCPFSGVDSNSGICRMCEPATEAGRAELAAETATTPGDAYFDATITLRMTPAQQAGYEADYGLEPGTAVTDATGRLQEVINDCLLQGGRVLPGYLTFSVGQPTVTTFAAGPAVPPGELEAIPDHSNDLGDWCPNSGQDSPGGKCPQLCRAAR